MPPNDIQHLVIEPQVQGIKEAFHLAFYHPVRTGLQERVSKYLQDFVHGAEPQTSRWISLAAPLISSGKSFDVIIRSLLNTETSPVEFTSLDRLCQAVAEASGAAYNPERLEKMRETADLSSLAGKAARAKELEGVFRFDATGLSPKAKILIVDAIMTTGATIEAIARAVKKVLPQAEIRCFVLGKANGKTPNSHLNPDYFTGDVESAAAADEAPRSARKSGAATLVRKPAKPRVDRVPPVREPLPSPRRDEKSPVPSTKEKNGGVRTYVIGLLMIIVVAGALVPLRSSRKSVTRPEVLPDALPVAVDLEPSAGEAEEETTPTPKAVDSFPKGVVSVPGVGLRAKHSLESKAIPRSKLRNGERISILDRYVPGVGPRWLQIKTKTGKVGWVFASVVKEGRKR
jgi:hypothetical protein